LPLPSVTFCVKLAWKLLTLSSRLLRSLAASAQTLLATKLVSNAQAIAIFSLLFLKIRLPDMGFPSSILDLPEGRRQKKMLILADLPFFAIAEG
jgi:hypothetical protein